MTLPSWTAGRAIATLFQCLGYSLPRHYSKCLSMREPKSRFHSSPNLPTSGEAPLQCADDHLLFLRQVTKHLFRISSVLRKEDARTNTSCLAIRQSGRSQGEVHSWQRGYSSLRHPKAPKNCLMGFFWQVSCSQSFTGTTGTATRGQAWPLFSLYLPKPSFLVKLEAVLKELFHSWI